MTVVSPRNTCFTMAVLCSGLLGAISGDASAEVMISELMYNPSSFEGRGASDGQPAVPNKVEWIELYNHGDAEADISGFLLQDEDGKTGPIPSGTRLKAGEALVVIPSEQSVAAFREAWGDGFQVIRVTGWGSGGGLNNLANSPSPSNEKLELKDAEGKTLDRVNFDDTNPWPSDSPQGPSIYVLPGKFTDNDRGSSWARSEPDTHGAKAAKRTDSYRDSDIGSPGVVIATDG